MCELLKRIIVASVGIPLVILIIWLGGWTLAGLVAIISIGGFYEFSKICEKMGDRPFFWINSFFIITYIFLLQSGLFRFIDDYLLILIFFTIVILTNLLFSLFSETANSLNQISYSIVGFFYAGILPSFILGIDDLFWVRSFDVPANTGFYLTIALLASVWASDSAAYFIGKSFGRRKLFPSVSPKKTWEGSIAGFSASIITFMVIAHFFLQSLGMINSIALAVIIAISSQLGDLAESKFKRAAGVKDSSSIIPGHGGILDRIDGLLFAFPSAFIYLRFTSFIFFIIYQ